MRYVSKRDYQRASASGTMNFGVAVVEGEPQTLKTGRGMLVSTSHLLALPTGALEKYQAQIIVFGATRITPIVKEVEAK